LALINSKKLANRTETQYEIRGLRRSHVPLKKEKRAKPKSRRRTKSNNRISLKAPQDGVSSGKKGEDQEGKKEVQMQEGEKRSGASAEITQNLHLGRLGGKKRDQRRSRSSFEAKNWGTPGKGEHVEGKRGLEGKL